MQKYKTITICVGMVLLLCIVGVTLYSNNSNSIIPDRRLEEIIRKQIGKPKGEITPEDCLGITELDLKSVGRNLEGLQYFHDLEVLRCTQGGLSDISAISQLTKLKDIDFYQNNISDLTPLSGLVNLKSLVLQKNKIQDLTPLATLTNLEYLAIGKNPVEYNSDGFVPLEKLHGLRINSYADYEIVIGRDELKSPHELEGESSDLG